MARTRMVKPRFFTDEELAELPPLTRLLFIGLWTIADRRGRLEDRPKRIKAEVLPYDEHDVNIALDALQEHGFIIRYIVDDKCFIQIKNFEKHQLCHKTERDSIIPARCNNGALTVITPLKNALIPYTDIPCTDNLYTDFVGNFLEHWGRYPNKDGKKAAEKYFMATIKNAEDEQQLRAALDNYLQCDKVKNGFIKNGSTWFNNWRDWIPEKEPELTPERKERLAEIEAALKKSKDREASWG